MSEKFKNWLDMLLFFRDSTSNREPMTEFFFESFAENPQDFYQFILFLKKQVQQGGELKKNILLAKRYLEILSPLCGRFGFYHAKVGMDDLCFNIVHPGKYLSIDRKLMAYKKKWKKILSAILKSLKQTLEKKGLNLRIQGRYKNIYSIYKKMQKNPHRDIDRIHDIFAFRVITQQGNTEECFEILSMLHDHFLPIASRFKDYITIPKINGYQSLHTGLLNVCPQYKGPVEVQIRTQEMHEFAEKGLAAHWIYGREKKSNRPPDREKKMLEYFSHLSGISREEKHVHCFSYNGDIFRMKKGSSVIDFAHRIHSRLSKMALFAKVNEQSVALHYEIQNGDRIEIMTQSPSAEPSTIPHFAS